MTRPTASIDKSEASELGCGVEKRRYVRPAPAVWAEIEAHWQSGEATLAELSARFGPSQRSLQHHFAKAGIVKGERAAAMAAAIKKEVFDAELGDEEQLRFRAKDLKERTYRNAMAIEELMMAQFANAANDPAQALRAATAMRAISLAANTLDRLHGVQQRALGLDKDNAFAEELPMIIIQDLSADDLAEIKKRHEEQYDGAIGIDASDADDDNEANDDDDIVIEGEDEDDNALEPKSESGALMDADGVPLAKSAA
jgi:hypothetical protein